MSQFVQLILCHYIYCRISIKLLPLHDHDQPDEIFVLLPYLEDCDNAKIPSDMTACKAISSMFRVELVVAIHW
jgi:hypothetical protein